MDSDSALDVTGPNDPGDDPRNEQRIDGVSTAGVSEALCARARQGEASALGELATRVRLRLKRFIGPFIPSWMLSKINQSDVVQGVLASAWNHPSQISVPWLFGVARMKVRKELRFFRRQRRDVRRERPLENLDAMETPRVEASPVETLMEQEQQSKLRERLNSLGKDGVLLRRICLERESYAAVGRDWGVKEATLRQRVARALKKFKLHSHEDEVTPDE